MSSATFDGPEPVLDWADAGAWLAPGTAVTSIAAPESVWNGCPHFLQNLASSRFDVLHDGQTILPSFIVASVNELHLYYLDLAAAPRVPSGELQIFF